MAAEVFSGQPAAYLGETDALLPDHEWDKPLPNPDAKETAEVRPDVAASMGKIPFNPYFHPEEWGPSTSPRMRHVTKSESLPTY